MKALVRLMTVPQEKRDLAWIQESLQAAIQLEFSTIPPYLYAAWSIDRSDDPQDCATVISDIAEEEMLHMGIACNALVAVGGRPQIVGVAPTYPTQLPVAIHKGLDVALAPLSADLLLTTFMAIEEPEIQFAEDPDFHPSGTVLIGQFYDELFAAIESVNPPLSGAGQVKLSSFGQDWVLTSVDDIRDGIDLIKRQGEGSAAGPFENKNDPTELAHFYQFGEIFHGRRLTRTSPFTYTEDEVTMPTVRNGAPAPSTLPEAVAFDQAYSDMLRRLESAWNGDAASLGSAIGQMFTLEPHAARLFEQGFGPGFRVVEPAEPEPEPEPEPSTGRYSDVLRILDASVGPAQFGAHRAFWRGMPRDEFVDHDVFAQQLVVVGDGSGSNLVKALRGHAPFGSDTGTSGATFRRMPAGRPPVAAADIDVVETWIDEGCPDDVVQDDTEVSVSTGGFRPDPSVHVAYFRDLDDWSLINRTPEVNAAVGVVFNLFSPWVDRLRDPANDQAWVDAISAPAATAALRLLSTLQRQTVERHYGVPVPLLAVLDGFERFGNDGLPDDPLRPDNPRHTMDGDSMWFLHASFAEACVHLGIAPTFWRFMMRALVCGLCNDGLFRDRFTVTGFTADAAGRQAVFEHAQTVADADLPAELGRRYVESGLL